MSKSEMNQSLIRALSIGWLYRKESESGKSIVEISKQLKTGNRTAYKYLNLGYLSPKVINDIMKNKIPNGMGLHKLFEIASQSMDFKDQEQAFYQPQ